MGDARRRQVESSPGPRPAIDETVAAVDPGDPAIAAIEPAVDDAVAALDATVALDPAFDRGCNASAARALQFLAGARLAENPAATTDAEPAGVETRSLAEQAKIDGWVPHVIRGPGIDENGNGIYGYNRSGIVVHNGTITEFAVGVSFGEGSFNDGVNVFHDLVISNMGYSGLSFTGGAAIDNSGHGVDALIESTVIGVTVSGNGANGIHLASGGNNNVVNCTGGNNGAASIVGCGDGNGCHQNYLP